MQTARAESDLDALKSIEPQTHAALRQKLLGLKVENPYAIGTLEKIGGGKYRVRQGNWRARCLVNDDQRAILIEDVVRRNEATYG